MANTQGRIEALENQHAAVDREIRQLSDPRVLPCDELKVATLKKKKLELKDQIGRLQ